MEEKKLYLIGEDLFNDDLIKKLIQEGKDKELKICYDAYEAGVAYLDSGEYVSYSTNERAGIENYQKHQSFIDAVMEARIYDHDILFEMEYCKKRSGK